MSPQPRQHSLFVDVSDDGHCGLCEVIPRCSFDLSFSNKSWTARRSNQSILKEISPGCSVEGLMLKLKLQYFGHLV